MTLADMIKQRMGGIEFDAFANEHRFAEVFDISKKTYAQKISFVDGSFDQFKILQAEITRRDEIWAKVVGKLERRLEDIIEIESLVKAEKSVLQSDCEETLAEILALIGQGE